MGLQTRLIQSLLYINVILIVSLVQPWISKIKKLLVYLYLRIFSIYAIKHIIYAIYSMVMLVLLDSLFRSYRFTDKLLIYQSQRNFYLTSFTIFLAWSTDKFIEIIKNNMKTEEINQYNQKQYGNSMTFVNNVIEQHKSEIAKNELLQKEIIVLNEKLEKNKDLINEIRIIKKSFFNLKDKYEKLKEEQSGETRKNK